MVNLTWLLKPLLFSPASSGSWTSHPLSSPTKDLGPYIYAGKFYITGLEGATQYLARWGIKHNDIFRSLTNERKRQTDNMPFIGDYSQGP